MYLTDEQKKMVEGKYGLGIQKAMTMLIKYGEAFGAERMTRVDSCHAASGPMPFVREILDGVEHVRAPCTLHAANAGACRMGRALGLKEEFCKAKQSSQYADLQLCVEKGFIPAMTCAPYLIGNVVKPGEVFSWPGSSGIIINNSLFSGRGKRDGFGITICSAVTGFTPDMMLLKEENRNAQLLAQVEGLDIENLNEAEFGAIGYYIGAIAELRNVAVDGISAPLSFVNAKSLLSPMPVSGAVSLCHIIGITPEAPTLQKALGHRKPEITIKISEKELKEGWESLHTAKTADVQVVFFGCPHLSIGEIEKVAKLLDGKRVAKGVRLWVSTAESIYVIAQRMGFVKIIDIAGGVMVTDTCLNSYPYNQMESPATTVATNSARAASYTARSGIGIQYGSFEQCINAAINGRWGG
jgi:cis-L-3-hydroxyproline dehydratase